MTKDLDSRTSIADTDKPTLYLSFLSKAVQEIGTSLDYEQTLSHIAHAMVPDLSDWCGVDIIQDNGSLKRLAVAHKNPKKIALAMKLTERFPPDPDSQSGTPKVLRTGEPEMFNEISDAMLVAGSRNQDHLKMLRALNINSLMIVPISSRKKTLGVITFVWAESRKTYSLPDLAFAQTLAGVAGSAIDNSRLYSKLLNK